MALFIGLTGPLGSGKGTVAEILTKLFNERGVQVTYRSLSDEIRGEIAREGKQLEREIQKKVANKFRASLGNGVWARLTASRIRDDLLHKDYQDGVFLIDSIRNPGEVHELRKEFGKRFLLIGINAPDHIIKKNLHQRKRSDESRKALEDEVQLQKLIKTEMGIGEPDFGHDISSCMEMADLPVIFNDGTKAELEVKTKALADEYIIPLIDK